MNIAPKVRKVREFIVFVYNYFLRFAIVLSQVHPRVVITFDARIYVVESWNRPHGVKTLHCKIYVHHFINSFLKTFKVHNHFYSKSFLYEIKSLPNFYFKLEFIIYNICNEGGKSKRRIESVFCLKFYLTCSIQRMSICSI